MRGPGRRVAIAGANLLAALVFITARARALGAGEHHCSICGQAAASSIESVLSGIDGPRHGAHCSLPFRLNTFVQFMFRDSVAGKSGCPDPEEAAWPPSLFVRPVVSRGCARGATPPAPGYPSASCFLSSKASGFSCCSQGAAGQKRGDARSGEAAARPLDAPCAAELTRTVGFLSPYFRVSS